MDLLLHDHMTIVYLTEDSVAYTHTPSACQRSSLSQYSEKKNSWSVQGVARSHLISSHLTDVVRIDDTLIQSRICLMFRACVKISIRSACVKKDHPLSSPVFVV